MRSIAKLGLVAAVGCAITASILTMRSNNPTTLVIGFPKTWGALHPALQNTMYGDAILGNQFDALVDMSETGQIRPLAAKSWDISDDGKIFVFKINRTKRFSNGELLAAHHFKEAWEDGLRMRALGENKSTADVLSEVVGYEQFAETAHLPGVIAHDDETLEIRFRRPFRMALQHLTGSRFAAYIKRDAKTLGTGPYVIADPAAESLALSRNSFSQERRGADQLIIRVVPGEKIAEQLSQGQIDVAPYVGRISLVSVCADVSRKTTKCLEGFESAHFVSAVNGLPGRIFSNPQLRSALLRGVRDGLRPGGTLHAALAETMGTGLEIDSQVYLPLQAGRLSEEEVSNIVGRFSDADKRLLREATTARPVRYLYTEGNKAGQAIGEHFKEIGVVLTDDSGGVPWSDLLRTISVESDADLAVYTQSVVDGDPDGLYHCLGESGAILDPMNLRATVARLLEEGRSLYDRAAVDAHYKEVSRAILREVPVIHFGFLKEITAYSPDRVEVSSTSLRSRVKEHFYLYEPR